MAQHGIRRGWSALRDDTAQATVEMAVVVPVMLVLALIVYNVMVFMSAAARFDRVAPDIVVAQGVSPAGEEFGNGAAVVAEQLEQAMDGYDVEIEVSAVYGDEAGGGSVLSMVGALKTYRCVMRYTPWPSSFSIAGVSLGAPFALTHERPVTVDPWRSGVII